MSKRSSARSESPTRLKYMASVCWEGPGWNAVATAWGRTRFSAVFRLNARLRTTWPDATVLLDAKASEPGPWMPGQWRHVTSGGVEVALVSPRPAPSPCALMQWQADGSLFAVELRIEDCDDWQAVAARALAAVPRPLRRVCA